ncbi:accessory gene regulator B family protein [Paenibacillus sp. sptzw28]|uniref:accessory gene regulator ArgB-like protein n=1 Tax=Paenibacillus sp. sptzw28 TaxID=715179 RepID=UPI001C6E42E6|nr:accessory gene regulator B family protein [Paenibacillus sp. sptzw28]QYR21623.1 accessory gene regulator B family protein [Paenibacillus sp. sptzw28]
MIERFAERLAFSINHHAQDSSSSVKVLTYGIIMLLDFLFILVLSLTIGALTGKFIETAIGMGCFLLLRSISGGYHFNTSMSCILFSTFVSVTIPHVALSSGVTLILYVISILLFVIYSPSNLQNQSRIPSKYYPALKWISVGIVVASFLPTMEVVTLAIFIQALSLVRFNRKGGETNAKGNC